MRLRNVRLRRRPAPEATDNVVPFPSQGPSEAVPEEEFAAIEEVPFPGGELPAVRSNAQATGEVPRKTASHFKVAGGLFGLLELELAARVVSEVDAELNGEAFQPPVPADEVDAALAVGVGFECDHVEQELFVGKGTRDALSRG